MAASVFHAADSCTQRRSSYPAALWLFRASSSSGTSSNKTQEKPASQAAFSAMR